MASGAKYHTLVDIRQGPNIEICSELTSAREGYVDMTGMTDNESSI